jgi:4-hydroxy-3-methylbut-2-enyl diphosphate reductase
LVSKVHRQAERHVEQDRHILFIGHAGHPEVIGTFGQVPEGRMSLVETAGQAETIEPPDGRSLAYLTQTTLSVDDTAEIIAVLQRRFPTIKGPKSEDICYATSNRQAAVKQIARSSDAVLVIGAANSSNSVRLREVAEREGVPAWLVARASDIDPGWLKDVRTLGITAGASAPEELVRETVDWLSRHFDVEERQPSGVEERMVFKLPRGLEAA